MNSLHDQLARLGACESALDFIQDNTLVSLEEAWCVWPNDRIADLIWLVARLDPNPASGDLIQQVTLLFHRALNAVFVDPSGFFVEDNEKAALDAHDEFETDIRYADWDWLRSEFDNLRNAQQEYAAAMYDAVLLIENDAVDGGAMVREMFDCPDDLTCPTRKQA